MRFLFSVLKRILDKQFLNHELYKMKEYELRDFLKVAEANGYIKVKKTGIHDSFEVTDKGSAFLDDFNHLEKELPVDLQELPYWVRFEGDVYQPPQSENLHNDQETNYIYNEWSHKLQLTYSSIIGRGGRSALSIDPPATENEILQVEKQLKYKLPVSFRKVLLEYSSKVYFYWGIEESKAARTSNGIIAGGGFFDYGLWNLDKLVEFDHYREDNEFLDENEEYKLWSNSLIFALNGMGDCIGVDMKYNIGEIVYLPHDNDSYGRRLGKSFESFMDNWINIGCSGLFIKELIGFSSAGGPYIDHRSANAVMIKNQLGLEN
ncbi:SMI1/KNR4 family protein [Paenibacillus sedimenti]|nr:SMI1/KNR4 family protein [Paenibacillus sedimenti]